MELGLGFICNNGDKERVSEASGAKISIPAE
jgi:hypothetical protein